MKIFFRFGQEIFWTMFWVFLVLILGFALLTWLSSRFSGNIIGNTAGWVESHAGGPSA